MSDFILSVEGTEAGKHLAMLLALVSAVAHAFFGALQKGRHDPWLVRGSVDLFYFLGALPLALFVFPPLEGGQWWLLLGVFVIHILYKILMAMAYSRAAYTVVYPITRGTGPLITVVFAYFVFRETFTLVQWLGVLLLSGGIFGLSAFNMMRLKAVHAGLGLAIAIAFLAGVTVAGYTVYDAYGMRAVANPFTFLAWFFVVDGLAFPVIATLRYRQMANPPALGPLLGRGLLGALIAYFSFGAVMLATRLDKVGEAAVLRETSTVFAALIGWFLLRETVGPTRVILMTLIALGAVVVEFGS